MSTDERTLICVTSMAARRILEDVARDFSDRTGISVRIEAMGGVDADRQVRAGYPCDLVALAAAPIETLIRDGYAVPSATANYARSALAVAVKADTPHPDLGTEAAVREALVAARSIGYSTGPSGDHVRRLWQRWELEDRLSQSAVLAPPGIPVATLLAEGRVDVGLQQESELLGQPGIEIVGRLPDPIALTTIFAIGVTQTSTRRLAGLSFIAFVRSPEAALVIRRHGMEPITGD